jgi:hypothetical protein
MGLNLKSIFSAGAEKLVSAVGDAFDKNFTNKEEKEAAKLAVMQEINRNFEMLQSQILKENELENADRDSARMREREIVKATGHSDYMMVFLAIVAIIIFSFIVFHLVRSSVPSENRELLTNIVGLVEGILLSIYTYYWGSSAGSRLKDIKK